MLTATAITAIALADLARLLPRRGWAWGTAVFAIAATVLLVVLGFTGWTPWVLLPAGIAVGWLVTTPLRDQERRRPLPLRLFPVTLLPIALLVTLAVDGGMPAPAGPIAAAIESAPLAAGFSAPTIAIAVAAGLALIETGNRIVRAALPAALLPIEPTVRRGWRRRPDAGVDRAAPVEQLKGGRLIGPLERLLLAGLLVSAAYPVVAALIAAKGIVRFPEISRSSGTGNAAEYFLVGSFVSWTAAAVAAALIALTAS